MNTSFYVGLALLLLILLTGCSDPSVPPEVQLAISQGQDLWRAGATVYAQHSYAFNTGHLVRAHSWRFRSQRLVPEPAVDFQLEFSEQLAV